MRSIFNIEGMDQVWSVIAYVTVSISCFSPKGSVTTSSAQTSLACNLIYERQIIWIPLGILDF